MFSKIKLSAAAAVLSLFIASAVRADDPEREIIIKFKPGIAEQEKTALGESFQAEELRPFYRDHFRVLRLPAAAGRRRILKLLEQHPAVAYAEPNRLVRAFGPPVQHPNDEHFDKQWNFQLIGIEQAWEHSTGEDVTVAVLDTGISPYGQDGFGSRLQKGYNAFVNFPGAAWDFHCHGTHVAGTIGQETNNDGIGTAGIAFSAQLLPVKVLNRFGYGSNATLAAGLRWAADNGADIINMSLGSPWGGRALEEAIQNASAMGIVIVAASGNEAGPVSYPAAYKQVIAVGAVDSAKQRTFYSNGGPELDLVAPGGSSEDLNGDGQPDAIMQETFKLHSGFAFFDIGWNYYPLMGTSMASPHVAGVAALIKSRHPDWSADEIRQALTATAEDLGSAGPDEDYGYGLVNAAAALEYELYK